MEHAERLSALDSSFLEIEKGGAHMHIGGLIVLRGGPLVREDGGVDFDAISAHVEAALDRVPRYRQTVVPTPVIGQPTWVDDAHFNLSYHLRHTALPCPGDDRQLKRLVGRVFSQRLDRQHPLWELWVVEGLTDRRLALILKVHHCLVDGVGGTELLVALLTQTGGQAEEEPEWAPRERAGLISRVGSELAYRVDGLREGAARIGAAVHGGPASEKPPLGLKQTLHDAADLLKRGLTPCDASVLNPKDVGPHRRMDICRIELEDMKAVKRALGGKINDVVLATAAGALRSSLSRRGVDVDALRNFRALIPINLRQGDSSSGNRVGMMFAELPLYEADARSRYEKIVAETTQMKQEGGQARITELLENLSDRFAPSLVGQIMSLSGAVRTFNVLITNVPGPPFELELLGAKVEGVYPLAPLLRNQALGIALFSYNGAMHWGLNADWGSVPDLNLMVEDLQASFEELQELCS